jgi:Ca-activated chloride channel family protein
MSAWKNFSNVLRRLDGILDVRELSQTPAAAEAPLGHWPGRTIDLLVIDSSYSMETQDYPPTRLAGAVQAATRFMCQRAETHPDSLAGIITFSRKATLVAPLRPLRDSLEEAVEALDAVTTGDHTNMAEGLALARQQIARVTAARRPRILLLTDGHSTVGGNPCATAMGIKEHGIQLDIIGIGGSPAEVDEATLKQMASLIDGERRYWFIKSVGELVRKFEALSLREF